MASLPPPALAWALGALAASVAAAACLTVAYRNVARPPVIPGVLLFYGCLYGILFGTCVRYSRRHGTGSLSADFGLNIRLRDSYRGLGVLVLANLAAGLAISPFVHQSRFQGSNTQALGHYRHDAKVYVVLALVAVLAAPFFEELFFRGLVYRALLGRIPRGWALLVQGAVFGSMHYNPYAGAHNVSVVVAITAMGVVLGWSADRFRRLGPGMVAHSLKNLTAVLVLLAQ